MNIVDEKFKEWTKGIDPLQARINIFNNIRDIPYAIVPEMMDYRGYTEYPESRQRFLFPQTFSIVRNVPAGSVYRFCMLSIRTAGMKLRKLWESIL